jgi:TusA-related sulfurtransferase
MGRSARLDLVTTPWPINLLKCNQWVTAMQPGEQLEVILDDANAKDSLVTVLKASQDYRVDVRKIKSGYRLVIRKHLG